MAKKTAIDRLDAEIMKILSDYKEDVQNNLGEISLKFAKKGAKALKAKSKETFPNGSGAYANDWKVETENKNHRVVESSNLIYNEHHYQLAHLLEHSHVISNGTKRIYGHTKAHEHIAPVEKELVETYVEEVLSKL